MLEVTGGFTGRAGKQTIDVDTAHLDAKDAAPMARDLGRIPGDAWGKSFLKPHPQPWDFVHVLRVVDAAGDRSVTFHLHEGPPGLSAVAERLVDIGPNEGGGS